MSKVTSFIFMTVNYIIITK